MEGIFRRNQNENYKKTTQKNNREEYSRMKIRGLIREYGSKSYLDFNQRKGPKGPTHDNEILNSIEMYHQSDLSNGQRPDARRIARLILGDISITPESITNAQDAWDRSPSSAAPSDFVEDVLWQIVDDVSRGG